MPSGWSTVRLRNVMRLDVDSVAVDPATRYRVAGVLNRGRGLFEREPMLGCDTSYKTLNRLRAGQVVMSRLKAWEGSVAVVPEGMDGCVASPEFPTYTCTAELRPSYMAIVCRQEWFAQALQGLAQGIGGRRERVHADRFLDVEMPLPPIAEQRRIVDLVEAARRVQDRYRDQATAARVAADALRCELWRRNGAALAPLASALTRVSAGASPMTLGRPPGPGEPSVVKVSAIQPGRFLPQETKAVSPEVTLAADALVRAGDVLMTRANTPERVGAVCRVAEPGVGVHLSDKTLRLAWNADVMDPDYLVEVLRAPDARRQLTAAASGSSASMFNISQAKIKATLIPLLPIAEQRRWAQLLTAATGVEMSADDAAAAAGRASASLESSLLSGVERLGANYDRVMVTT